MNHLVGKVVVFPGYDTSNFTTVLDTILVLDIDEMFYLTWNEIIDDMKKYHGLMKAQYDISYSRMLECINLVAPPSKNAAEIQKTRESASCDLITDIKPYKTNQGCYIAPKFMWVNTLTGVNNKYEAGTYAPFRLGTIAVCILGRKNALGETDIYICWGKHNVKINHLFELEGMDALNRILQAGALGITNPLEQLK